MTADSVRMDVHGGGVEPALGPEIEWFRSSLRCPACRVGSVSFAEGTPACTQCSWQGRFTQGILDCVVETELTSHHLAEMAAQSFAVGAYYENEGKLSCHLVRIAAVELPSLLDWSSGLVLDLGCGTGGAGSAFREVGAKVIGVDISLPCLERAQRRLSAVVRAEGGQLPFADDTFDAVVSRNALHHILDPQRAVAEARRVLKPGARALFIDPRQLPGIEQVKRLLRRHDASFTRDQHAMRREAYRAMIEEHFEIEAMYTRDPIGALWAGGLDVVGVPYFVPKRLLAEGLTWLDHRLNNTPARAAGQTLMIRARKRS